MIKPCKHCGRLGFVIQNSNVIGKQIIKEKCIFCNGKGFTHDLSEKEKNINDINKNMKGGKN